MHSSTYYRQAAKSKLAIDRREKIAAQIQQENAACNGYTAEDREVADALVAAEMFADFLANEI